MKERLNLRNFGLVILICLLFCFPTSGWAAVSVYYVDPSGTDDVDHGTSAGTGAWETLHYAVNQKINLMAPSADGFLLNVGAGTYSLGTEEDNSPLIISQDNVTILGAGELDLVEQTLIVNVSAEPAWGTGIIIDASHVTIAQLGVESFPGRGIYIVSGSGNIIEGCTILSNWRGIQIDSPSQGNIVRNETWINSSTDAGIYINNSSGNQIYGNTIFDNGGGSPGIEVVSSGADYNMIHHNKIYDSDGFSQGVGINLDSAGIGNEIYQNEIYGHSSSPEISKNEIYNNDTGIQVVANGGTASPSILNNLIYVDGGTMVDGIYVNTIGSVGDEASPKIYHNTIDGGDSDGVEMAGAGTISPDIKYNIVTNFTTSGIKNSGGTPVIDYNDVWNNGTNYSGVAAGTNDISPPEDPDYIDPANQNYELDAISPSPCIDSIPWAAADRTIEQDIAGIARPQPEESAYDMGCYEYAPSTTQPVSIPPGTQVADYRMVAFTVQPDDPACTSVFGDEMGGAYNPANFKIGTYDPTIGSYVECGSGLDIVPGKAYWMLARNGFDATVHGTPASMSDTDVSLDYNSSTGNGWNQIGCPNAADYDWVAGVEVYEKNAEGSIVQGPTVIYLLPDDNDMIDKRLWCWDNGSYYPDNVEMLQREGYWVKAKKANIWLRFRQDARVVVAQVSNQDTMFAGLFKKAKTWVNKWILGSQVAIADSGDSPPMPMAAISGSSADSEGGGGGGCFVDSLQ
jgi:parallel beta-helix repeat protein